MTKKKQRRQQARVKRPAQTTGFDLGRYYRHHKKRIHRIAVQVAIGIAALAVIVIAVVLFRKHGVSLTKADYVREARKNLMLGYFEDAVVNYHQAQNADPTDESVNREMAMAQRRAEIASGGSPERAIGAAMQVLSKDSNSAVAHLDLSQLYYGLGDLISTNRHALSAMRFADDRADTVALLSASLSLLSYHRKKDQFDSAVTFGEKAISLAESVGDAVSLALAQAGTGFSLLRLGNLDRARGLFHTVLNGGGNRYPYLARLAKLGLADCFYIAKDFDSARIYASDVETQYQSSTNNEIATQATQLLGKISRAREDYVQAVSKLNTSLDAWRSLGDLPEVIDNLNDLAEAYYDQKDFVNARKFYMAAGKMAKKYDFPTKDHYTADMNLRLLRNLSSEEYLRAGNEGAALAEKYSFR